MRKLWVIDSIINIHTSIKYISGRDLSQSTNIKDVPIKMNGIYVLLLSFYNENYNKYVLTLFIWINLQTNCMCNMDIDFDIHAPRKWIFFVGNRKQRKRVNTTYVIVSYTIYGYITFFLNCLKVNINHNFEWCKLCGTLIESKYVVEMHIYRYLDTYR